MQSKVRKIVTVLLTKLAARHMKRQRRLRVMAATSDSHGSCHDLAQRSEHALLYILTSVLRTSSLLILV